jgi:hypothetical protein
VSTKISELGKQISFRRSMVGPFAYLSLRVYYSCAFLFWRRNLTTQSFAVHGAQLDGSGAVLQSTDHLYVYARNRLPEQLSLTRNLNYRSNPVCSFEHGGVELPQRIRGIQRLRRERVCQQELPAAHPSAEGPLCREKRAFRVRLRRGDRSERMLICLVGAEELPDNLASPAKKQKPSPNLCRRRKLTYCSFLKLFKNGMSRPLSTHTI